MKKYIILSILCISIGNLTAQDIGFGFNAGLSVSSILGSEVEANATETSGFVTGFHIGGNVNFKITDVFGVKAGLVFSQKGTKYSFSSDEAYLQFYRDNGGNAIATGTKTIDLQLSNAYMEIPIFAYGRFGDFEISGGVYGGFLIGAGGGGDLTFNGNSNASNQPIDPVEFTLNYNYVQDMVRQAFPGGSKTIKIDGQTLTIPDALGAYYFFEEDNGNAYKVFDYGVMGGLAYFFNEGLSFGVKALYGLNDITKDAYDVSQVSLESNGDYIFRDDKDVNLNLQFSIGLSF